MTSFFATSVQHFIIYFLSAYGNSHRTSGLFIRLPLTGVNCNLTESSVSSVSVVGAVEQRGDERVHFTTLICPPLYLTTASTYKVEDSFLELDELLSDNCDVTETVLCTKKIQS